MSEITREEVITKIAQEMLETVANEIANEPMSKEASEDDQVQAVADKLAEIYNEQSEIQKQAEEAFAQAEANEKIAMEAIDQCGYEIADSEEA